MVVIDPLTGPQMGGQQKDWIICGAGYDRYACQSWRILLLQMATLGPHIGSQTHLEEDKGRNDQQLLMMELTNQQIVVVER